MRDTFLLWAGPPRPGGGLNWLASLAGRSVGWPSAGFASRLADEMKSVGNGTYRLLLVVKSCRLAALVDRSM